MRDTCWWSSLSALDTEVRGAVADFEDDVVRYEDADPPQPRTTTRPCADAALAVRPFFEHMHLR